MDLMSANGVSREVTITNPQGLHLRPAHAFVTLANQFASKIEIERDGERVDGKSILSILALAVVQNTQICLRACGDDAEQALEALADLLVRFAAEETDPTANGPSPADRGERASG